MVMFALIGKNRTLSIKPIDKSYDVLSDLMGLNNTVNNKGDTGDDSNDILNTSSFNLQNIMNQLATKSDVNYKDALINNLYAQTEYLRNDALIKNDIIQSLINKINTTECSKNTESLQPNSSRSTSNTSYSDTSDDENLSIDNSDLLNITLPDTDRMKMDTDDQLKVIRDLRRSEYYANKADNDFAAWEKYTSGYGSKIMQKMGYRGGGLGKDENGIINPITAESKNVFRNSIEETGNILPQIVPSRVENYVHPWPQNTTLITGSSILMGVEENRLKKYKTKVRAFPGAYVDDLYDYLAPLLLKKPSNIILHIGSNDSQYKTAEDIFTEIMNLKTHIENILPTTKVFISCPVIRRDNARANSVLLELKKKIHSLNNIVKNDNVDQTCLGKKGLHLNEKGAGRLAINYISLMKRL